jgi:hypothetical protein
MTLEDAIRISEVEIALDTNLTLQIPCAFKPFKDDEGKKWRECKKAICAVKGSVENRMRLLSFSNLQKFITIGNFLYFEVDITPESIVINDKEIDKRSILNSLPSDDWVPE